MVLEVHGGFKEVRSGLQAAGVGLGRFLGGLGRRSPPRGDLNSRKITTVLPIGVDST